MPKLNPANRFNQLSHRTHTTQETSKRLAAVLRAGAGAPAKEYALAGSAVGCCPRTPPHAYVACGRRLSASLQPHPPPPQQGAATPPSRRSRREAHIHSSQQQPCRRASSCPWGPTGRRSACTEVRVFVGWGVGWWWWGAVRAYRGMGSVCGGGGRVRGGVTNGVCVRLLDRPIDDALGRSIDLGCQHPASAAPESA